MDVTDAERRPQPGQIVRVLRGREAGRYAIVISVEEPHFVHLADGDKRKFGRSKRKNVKHIQPTKHIAREVAEDLERDGRVTNAKLRYALNQYLLKQESKKGE
jgi:large subunit ribosomal protein L14e